MKGMCGKTKERCRHLKISQLRHKIEMRGEDIQKIKAKKWDQERTNVSEVRANLY